MGGPRIVEDDWVFTDPKRNLYVRRVGDSYVTRKLDEVGADAPQINPLDGEEVSNGRP